MATGTSPNIGHWKKRNRDALEEVNPGNLDQKLMRELFERFGGQQLAERLERSSTFANAGNVATGNIKDLDDFSACQIERAEDIRELFTRNFYCCIKVGGPNQDNLFQQLQANPDPVVPVFVL